MDASLSSLITEVKACRSDSFDTNRPLGGSLILSDRGKTIFENFGINFL